MSKDIEAQYAEIVRNLTVDDRRRIESCEVTASERLASPKLRAACNTWEHVKAERALRNVTA